MSFHIMRRISKTRRLWILLFLLGWWSALLHAQPPLTDDALRGLSVPELEQAILANDDPAGLDAHDRLWAALKTNVQPRIGLRVRNAVFYAAEIYICPQLSGESGLECRYLYADDTLHLTEFPESYLAVPWPPPYAAESECLRVDVAPEVDRAALVFYRGEPGAMHVTGYRAVTPVTLLPDGALLLPEHATGRTSVVFTIVRFPDEFLFKKYVWVVGVDHEILK